MRKLICHGNEHDIQIRNENVNVYICKIFNYLIFQSPDTLQWQNDYLQGTGCEMYTETLSPTFTGMTFSQASE